jgi:hypothetical protein
VARYSGRGSFAREAGALVAPSGSDPVIGDDSDDEADEQEAARRLQEREIEANLLAQNSLRAQVRDGAGERRSTRLGRNTNRAGVVTSFRDLLGVSNRSRPSHGARTSFESSGADGP